MNIDFDFEGMTVKEFRTVLMGSITEIAPIWAKRCKSWDLAADPSQEDTYPALDFFDEWQPVVTAFYMSAAAYREKVAETTNKTVLEWDMTKITVLEYQQTSNISTSDPNFHALALKVAARCKNWKWGKKDISTIDNLDYFKEWMMVGKGYSEALSLRARALGE